MKRTKYMILTLILCATVLVLMLFIGHFYIEFHPFKIGFARPYNLLGWIAIFVVGIAFWLDNRQTERERYTKLLMEYQEHVDSINLKKDAIIKKLTKELHNVSDVKLNNNDTQDNGNEHHN